MTHARGQTDPLLSSSCFLNKQTAHTDTAPLHRWVPRKHNIASKLQIVPKPVSPASMETLLPRVWSLLEVRADLPPTTERS